MVQTWTFSVGGASSIPDQAIRIPHASGPKTKTEDRSNIIAKSLKTLKMIHLKNFFQKRKKEAECSRLVGGRFNKQGGVPARFVFCKRNRSPYLPDRASGVSREALAVRHYPV